MPVCGLSFGSPYPSPPEGDMELPSHLFPVIAHMINLITSFLSGTVRASRYRYQHFMSNGKMLFAKEKGASPDPYGCTSLLSTDAGFDTCICQAVSTAKYLFALFAPRPPSRELSGWLTVISSMGISPVRVSCRPTAGSTIMTGCAFIACREQPFIWAGLIAPLPWKSVFVSLRQDHGGLPLRLGTSECIRIAVRIQLS